MRLRIWNWFFTSNTNRALESINIIERRDDNNQFVVLLPGLSQSLACAQHIKIVRKPQVKQLFLTQWGSLLSQEAVSRNSSFSFLFEIRKEETSPERCIGLLEKKLEINALHCEIGILSWVQVTTSLGSFHDARWTSSFPISTWPYWIRIGLKTWPLSGLYGSKKKWSTVDNLA